MEIAMLEPKEGLLTFRAEGNNDSGSAYYSRKIHWPGNRASCSKNNSGVTIGRGLDLGGRSKEEVMHMLAMAGILKEQAKKIAEGSKLTHCQAGDFVRENRIDVGEITESQQLRIFDSLYQRYCKDAECFYNRHKKSDSVSWGNLDSTLKDVVVDMLYQGRLRPDMISVIGKNQKNDVINLIKNSVSLSHDEAARDRIGYIKSRMK